MIVFFIYVRKYYKVMLLFEVPLLGDSVGLVILGSIRFKE